MHRFIILAIASALVLVSQSSLAASKWGLCGSTSVASAVVGITDGRISQGESECFYFDGTESSDAFVVQTETALIFFRPDAGGEANGDAAIMIARCLPGTEAYDANLCAYILDTALETALLFIHADVEPVLDQDNVIVEKYFFE